jgi:hypothetical protein
MTGYISPEARHQRWLARRAEAERTNAVCQCCGEPIDYEVVRPHRKAYDSRHGGPHLHHGCLVAGEH